ncbi:MAG: D-glycerate dehydrogenase [Actinomycetia bacterium]|nr:D-glycerate dehydrogenase [Actinomycetes bacterium]
MKICVLSRVAPEAIERLAQAGDVRVWTEPGPIPRDRLVAWIADADAVMTMLTDRVDRDLLKHAGRLKIAANMAVGYDNLDVEAATEAGVMVTNTPDVLTEATAELAWALMLAVMRNVVGAREAMLRGEWTHWSPDGFLGTELHGKTLGIVGFGRIGRAVARRAEAFGMRVIALGRQAPYQPPYVDRATFLREADVVSLHVPLSPATRGMVDRAWLAAMRPGSYLINTARGGIVDETALLEALDGHLGGAGLDVFAVEPVGGDHPLVRHPKVVATPHIGSATRETRRAMALRAADNILAALAGRRPPDLLNPVVWERRAARRHDA